MRLKTNCESSLHAVPWTALENGDSSALQWGQWLTTSLEPFQWQPEAQGMEGKMLNRFPDELVHYFSGSPLITFVSQKFKK